MASRPVHIALVGKYVELHDAYKSIAEALLHAAVYHDARLHIHWISSENITEENVHERLQSMDGILIAPGFGERGIEGKIRALRFARENNVPMLGICFGMQMAVVEFARNVLGWKEAGSTEINPATPYPVVDLLPGQKQEGPKGGTMRLGQKEIRLQPGSRLHRAYGTLLIRERHRHRYFFNEKYKEQFQQAGFRVTAVDTRHGLAEAFELDNHPWYVAVQFHPEYQSTVDNPHPLFMAFMNQALAQKSSL